MAYIRAHLLRIKKQARAEPGICTELLLRRSLCRVYGGGEARVALGAKTTRCLSFLIDDEGNMADIRDTWTRDGEKVISFEADVNDDDVGILRNEAAIVAIIVLITVSGMENCVYCSTQT